MKLPNGKLICDECGEVCDRLTTCEDGDFCDECLMIADAKYDNLQKWDERR